MLTIEGVPEALEDSYNELKAASLEIYTVLAHLAERQRLKSNVDILQYGADKMLYIHDGIFKLVMDGKAVRLYSENDFVSPGNGDSNLALKSDFATEISVLDWSACLEILKKRPILMLKWSNLTNLENKLNLSLCATLIEETSEPKLEIRQFSGGEKIFKEGDAATEIYEMIAGHAAVRLNGVTVGAVYTGEIFGEMSFLADSPRTATVVANGACCVRVVKGEQLFQLLDTNAHLSAALSKTLAKRIVEMTNHVVGGI
jgi:hypothetical protein